jgi:hypothetical protein
LTTMHATRQRRLIVIHAWHVIRRRPNLRFSRGCLWLCIGAILSHCIPRTQYRAEFFRRYLQCSLFFIDPVNLVRFDRPAAGRRAERRRPAQVPDSCRLRERAGSA